MLSRTLNSWSATNISWNDSDPGTDTANYTLAGLAPDELYMIYNFSQNFMNISATSEGTLSFTIALNTTSREIRVQDSGFHVISNCGVIRQNNSLYQLNNSFINTTANPCINITAFNTTFDCQGYSMTGSTSNNGIIIYWTSSQNTNDTIKNCNVTNWNDGIYIYKSSSNTLTNNTANNNGVGIGLSSSSNNTITGGSIASSSNYDYYLSNAGSTNNFISTNFTIRKISFADAISWFGYDNYTNDISKNSTLYTNLSTPANLTRNLIFWNISQFSPTAPKYDIMFNDSATSSLNASYNFTSIMKNSTDLLKNVIFIVIINNSLSYKLNTGENAFINFTVNLSTANTTIYIKYPHPPLWSNPQNWSPSTYSNTTPSQFNVTWAEPMNGMKQANISIWNSSYVLVNNVSMTNQSVIGTDPANWTYSMILPAGNWSWNSYATDIDQPYADENITPTYNITIGKANSAPIIQNITFKSENLGGNENYTLEAKYSTCIDCQNYTNDDINFWYFDGWGQQISFTNDTLVLNLTANISQYGFPFSKNLTLNNTGNMKTTYNITLNLSKSWFYQNETGTANRTYQLIARNATWQNNAPTGYPINITWNFSSPSGATSNLTAQDGTFNLSSGSSQTNKTVWYGDWINETNETWKQDPSRISVANSTVYVTHDIWLNNSWNFTINNLNIAEYLPDRSGWSCFDKLSTVSVTVSTNQSYNQSVNCSANNIILGYQKQWAQNTSIQSNTSIQYINTTVNLTSSDSINYTNVSYTHPYPCPNNFTCSGFSTTMNYTVNNSGNITYYSGSGNVILPSQSSWAQDLTRTSSDTVQYINSTINLARNDTSPSINFTNIQYSSVTQCPSPFSASGSLVETNYSVPITGNITVYNCSGSVISVSNNFWAQNTSNTSQTINSQNINETIRLTRTDSTGITFNISYSPTGFCVQSPEFNSLPVDPCTISYWYVNQSGNTSMFKGYGNAIGKGRTNWTQNTSATSTVSIVYINRSLVLNNPKSFSFVSLNYTNSDWSLGATQCYNSCNNECPLNFLCSDLNGTVSISSSGSTTLYANGTGDVISENQTNWTQNTSAPSNLSVQYINTTVNLTRTDGSNINLTNIQYSGLVQCSQAQTGFSGDTVSSSYYVPITSNISYFKCSGDVLNETWLNWQQDWTRTTLANGTAFTTRNITIQNNATNPYLNFTNIPTNWTNQNRTSSWTCSGPLPDSFNINYNNWTNFTMVMNCSAQNIIQPLNTSGWIQDNSSITKAAGYAYVKGKSFFNNTDTISYSNVAANSTSYHNATLRRDPTWNCSWNSTLSENLNFNVGQTNQTSGYSVLCNQNNTITKTDQPWTSDNSTEQNITKQWIIKKVNGTNNDNNITYVNVNYTISEFPNCKSGYTCNVTSENITVSNGTTWTRWANASNASVVIDTIWTNKYSAPDYYQNITVNDTGDIIFYNLTAWSLNFNDTNITAGTEYIKYLSGSQWIDITPASNDTNCNTSSPVYTANSTVNGTFYVCKKDTNSNGKIDYFKFKIPHTSVQILQVGGNDITYPASNSNGTNTSIPNYGKAVLIYANWSDDIALSKAWLWTNETGPNGKNYTDGTYNSTFNFTANPQWSNFTWQNNSIMPKTLISWRIYANDTSNNVNFTQGLFRVWGWANVTEMSIQNLVSGQINRTISNVTCRVVDANFSNGIVNYPVNFYKNNTLVNTSLTDSNGYVIWTYNSTPDLGPYIIKCNITNNDTLFYNYSVNQMNTSIEVWRKIYLNLTVNPSSIHRSSQYPPDQSDMQAYVYDDNATNINNITVCFYRKNVTGTNFFSVSSPCPVTGGDGIAIAQYNATEKNDNFPSWPPQNYTIFANHSTLSYSYNASNITYLQIYGKLSPTITSPVFGERHYKGETIQLTSTTSDEYQNDRTGTLDGSNWTLNTGELLNQSESGEWVIPITQPSGNYTINYSVYKTWYDLNWTTTNISIFGHSAVNESGPNLVYRQSNANYTGTVYDYANNYGINNYNCMWWVNSTNLQNSSTDISGNCSFNWTSTCSNAAGPYYVNVSILNDSILNYDVEPGHGIASINVNLTGNLSTLINVPSSNAILHRGDNAQLNSSVIDDCGNNFDNNSVSAMWYLDSLNAPGINSTLSIPINYLGPKTLISNVTKDYYAKGENSTTVYVYGWANVTEMSPPTGIYSKGDIIVISCHVRDANTSEDKINYPVIFYLNDSYRFTNLTNNTGYSIWVWNTTNDDSGINYTVKCNITNNDTLFYNASDPNQQQTYIFIKSSLIIKNITKDPLGDLLHPIYRNDSWSRIYGYNYNTTITVLVWQASLGPANGANCSFYNSTTYLNSSLTNSSGYCNITFNPPDDTIPQNYTIYINATQVGYSNSETDATNVIVKGSLSATITWPSAGFKIYRGESSWFNSTIKDENLNPVVDATANYWNDSPAEPTAYKFAGPGNGNSIGSIPIDHPLGNDVSVYEYVNKEFYDYPEVKLTSIQVWGWANVTILQPSAGNISRGNLVNELCSVTDANNSLGISDYQIKFWNDSTNSYSANSNLTGYVNYTWNTSGVAAGYHTLNCTISPNTTQNYNASINKSSVSVNIIGNLTASLVSVNATTIYRNDTWANQQTPKQNFTSNISVHIQDEYSNSVSNANVSFYQNESFIGYCSALTDSNGNCSFLYNPLDNAIPGYYSIKFNATNPPYYYSSNTVETLILVKGKLYSTIVDIPSIMYRNTTYWLNSTTKDENGNSTSPVFGSWLKNGDDISPTDGSENKTWPADSNEPTGNTTFSYKASKDFYTASTQINQIVQIWTKANVTLYSPLGATYNRGSSITYYANATDYYNDSPVSRYNCSWWIDGLKINSSLTNSQGTCNWTWYTGCSNFTRDYAGMHTINSTIASNSTVFYDANINESDTNTTIQGSLSIKIDSPSNNSVWHKTDLLWLNSTVNSECSLEPIASLTVNWILNNTQIAIGINNSTVISQNQTPGPYFINTTVNKTYYYSAYNISNIQIWGWANISWIYPTNNTEGHGQVLTMTCGVLDANNSTGISGYNVSFWKNGIYNGSNMTVTGGNATINWDTSEGLGSYAWKCNISDNSTLYYNKSTYEATYNVNVTDSIPPRIENLTITPNSSFEANYNSTNITVDVWDSVQRNTTWTNIKGPSYNQNFTMTNLNGNTFNLTFTPVQGGLHNVTVYANDSSNNLNTTQGSFTVIGNTTGLLLQDQDITATNITKSSNYTFDLNVTLNNTGNGTMRFVNISITSISSYIYANSTYYACQNLTPGNNCTTAFRINVIYNLTPGLQNHIEINSSWQNPDYSTGYASNITTITADKNTVLKLDKNSIIENVTHGVPKIVGNFTIYAWGNTRLRNVNSSLISGNLSESWISYISAPQGPPWNISAPTPSQQFVQINITTPLGQAPGLYWSNITVNATGSFTDDGANCSPPNECWDYLWLNTTVLEDKNWTLSPIEQNITIPTQTLGSFYATLNNSGNVNRTWKVEYCYENTSTPSNCDGDIGPGITPTSPFYSLVNKTNSSNITFDYDASGVVGGKVYTLKIIFSNNTVNPTNVTAYVYMNVTDTPPQIENISVSPAFVDVNYKNVTIQADVTDNIAVNNVWAYLIKPSGEENKTMSSISGNTYRVIFIPDQIGTYYVRIYANDSQTIPAGTNYSNLYNFTSVGNTSLSISSNPTSVNIDGITQDSGNSFVLNVSINNTEQGGAYYANQTFELPSGWSANPLNFSYNNLTAGSFRSNASTISVPKATSPGMYYVNATASWLNPNNTISTNKTTITVIVSSNPVLNIIQNTISMTLNQDSSNSTNFTLNSTGNTNVNNTIINCTSGNCTDLNISFNPNYASSLSPMSSLNVTVNASAYLGFPAGNYLMIINASGTGTSDTVNLNVTILENKSWNRTPDSFSPLSVGLNLTGDIGTINITNYGNVPIIFNVSIINTTENATDHIFVNASTITVNKQSSGYVRVNYSSPDYIEPSSVTYSVNISINNSTASPNYSLNTTASIKVYKFKLIILSPNQTNPVSLYTGNVTEIHVNATLGDTILGSGENITWNVNFINTTTSTSCPLNGTPIFNGNYWIINCTAPALTDAMNYTLNVRSSYTNVTAGIIDTIATDSKVNSIYYVDITPPNITPYVQSVPIGSTASIRANITDNLAVSKAISEVAYPNSSKINYTMTNILNISNITIWEYNLTNSAKGDYDVKVYANDTTNNWNSNTTWFEAYDPLLAWFNGTTLDKDNSPVIINFSLYRPNTTTKLYNFSSNASGNYSQQINKRYYDFNILVFNNTINLTNVSITGNVGNSTAAPISLDNIPVSQIGSGTRISKAMYVQTILNYTNALLVLNYTGTSYTSENYLGVYRCSNWSFSNRSCVSNWNRTSSTINTAAKTLTINTTDLSGAYAAAEFICGDGNCEASYGESNAVCPTDCPSPAVTPSGPSGGGGGGGGGVTPIQPEVTVPISLSTSLIEVRLYPGEYQISSIGITNNKKESADISLSVDGDIWPFTMFENDTLTIGPKQTAYAKIKFFTMPTTIPGVYNGDIIVKSGGITQKISVILRVEYEREKLLDIKVEAITKEVLAGQNLKYQVTLYNLGLTKSVDVFINYTVKSVETDKIITVDKETMAIETTLSFMRMMAIPEKTEPGLYTIEAVAWYENKSASSVASFSVVSTPWIFSFLLMIFTNWITYVILFVAIPCFYLGWKTYEKWKVTKKVRARYIRPININKLPTKGLWLGKVAETNTNAFFDESKLTTHMIIAGGTGSGKTVAGMDIAEECLKKGISVIVFDPTAQWTGFIRSSKDKSMQSLYTKFGIKPEESRGFKGTIVQVKDPFLKVEVEKYIKEGEITIFVLNKLTPDQLDYFIRKTVDYMFTVPWPESRQLKTLFVFDEIHRLLPKYAKQTGISLGGGEGYLAIERACREFRKWGLGLIMISQVLLDFRGAIRAVIATEAQLRTKYEGDIERIKTKYGWEYSTAIPKLEVGTGMIQNPEYNDGKPWFIRFRPLLHDSFRLTEEELNMYEDYMKEIEDIGKKIETLKSRNIDTYDMELELKLALDKVKTAQMRMAETYIESVKSRIKIIEERS